MDLPSLRALRSGDPTAWDEIYNWLMPKALTAARYRLGKRYPEEVEDVAVEALEDVVGLVNGVKNVLELEPLVWRVASRRAIDLLRRLDSKKRGGGKVESFDQQHHEVSDPAPLPDEQAHKREISELVARFLEGLEPKQRAVMIEFYLEGRTYGEIARDHKLAVNSVGVYLVRAREIIGKLAQQNPELLKEVEALLRLIMLGILSLTVTK